MKCSNCGYENPRDVRFCGMCGARLVQVCPACNYANPAGFRFCGMCGRLLVSDSPTVVKPSEGIPDSLISQPRPFAAGERRPQRDAFLSPLSGEKRVATVLLVDITGSTDLLEQYGSETWADTIQRILQMLEVEVYRYGGEVDQFRGDALVAFFGATTAHEDDPERAVLSALSMLQAFQRYQEQLSSKDRLDLNLRIGVNTGDLVVASVGDRNKYSEDTAMGMGVALAARLHSAASPGSVLVSESTYRQAATSFLWEPLGEINVKGITRPVFVYRPLSQNLSDLRTLEHSGEFVMTLIGRDQEFVQLKDCIEDLFDGKGSIFILTGDRGMGKSFLMDEVWHYYAHCGKLSLPGDLESSYPTLKWLRGRCRSFGQAWPYFMWVDLLRDWLEFRDGETKEELRCRLVQKTTQLWGERMAEHYPYLATFLSLPIEPEFADRVKHLDANSLHQRFSLALCSWVETMARQGPLVLGFSDMQWCDGSSLDLMKRCLAICEQETLLWLLDFRSERTSPVWEFRHFVETEFPHRIRVVDLKPLNGIQSQEFIHTILGSNILPKETLALVIARAEGNPYYLWEWIQSLMAQNVLVKEDSSGAWKVARRVSSLDLPENLQRLLTARIDQLPPSERQVMQLASVVGAIFWSNLLAELVDNPDMLPRHLANLQKMDMIQESGRLPELGRQFTFKSNLVRDAAYESMLNTQRVQSHKKVASFLERIKTPNELSGFDSILAYHFRQAMDHRKELFYSLQAAERAKRFYANTEALAHYDRALQLLDELTNQDASVDRLYAIDSQRFEVLNGRREVYVLMGKEDAGDADAQEMLRLARRMVDDPAWLIDALLRQVGVSDWKSREECQAGIPMAEEALSLARRSGDRRREMQSLFAISRQRLYLLDPTWQQIAESSLALARALDDKSYLVRILINLGLICSWSDQVELGTQYLKAALPISKALDDKMAEVELYDQLGIHLEREGDYVRLLEDYQRKRLKLSREIGYRYGEGSSLILCGQTQSIYLGDYSAGFTLLEEGLKVFQGRPDEVFALLRIAQIQAILGEVENALATLEKMDRIEDTSIFFSGRAGIRIMRAIVYNATEEEARVREVLNIIEDAVTLVETSPLISRQYQVAAACQAAVAHLFLAQLPGNSKIQARDHCRRALKWTQQGLEIFQISGFLQIIECVSQEILYWHSQALKANRHFKRADAYLEMAYDEMMRKYQLIPVDSSFQHTYLENIPLHREISAQYAKRKRQSITSPLT